MPTFRWIGASLLLVAIVGASIDLEPDHDLNWLETVTVESVGRPRAILQFALIEGIFGGAGIYARGWEYTPAGKSPGKKSHGFKK